MRPMLDTSAETSKQLELAHDRSARRLVGRVRGRADKTGRTAQHGATYVRGDLGPLHRD